MKSYCKQLKDMYYFFVLINFCDVLPTQKNRHLLWRLSALNEYSSTVFSKYATFYSDFLFSLYFIIYAFLLFFSLPFSSFLAIYCQQSSTMCLFILIFVNNYRLFSASHIQSLTFLFFILTKTIDYFWQSNSVSCILLYFEVWQKLQTIIN